jgi:lipoprotein-anchoring transpeptidase ErfK/SrfK
MNELEPAPIPEVHRPRRTQLAQQRRRRRATWALATAVVALVTAAAVVVGTDRADRAERVDAASVSDTADATSSTSSTTPPSTTTTVPPAPTTPPDEVLPESGAGRRVVFSIGRQRMWWVDEAGAVLRTSLVSGRANTPTTGTFQVYSKTLNATGLDGSRMDYFVRFTKGPNGWAIGFHDIPEVDGVPVQTEEQLGQPLSHGCIRQREDDARFTWDYLQVGDTVVVVA